MNNYINIQAEIIFLLNYVESLELFRGQAGKAVIFKQIGK